MRARGMAAACAVFVMLVAGCSSDRFGDRAVLDRIKSSTDCGYLHRVNDEALHDFDGGDPALGWTGDQATGYFNATNERMKQLGC